MLVLKSKYKALQNKNTELIKQNLQLFELKSDLLRYLDKEKASLSIAEQKEKGKARPNEKALYALEQTRFKLAEVRDRVLEIYWKD